MKHSAVMVNELHAVKRLILTHVEFVVHFLLHRSGLLGQAKKIRGFTNPQIPEIKEAMGKGVQSTSINPCLVRYGN